VKDHLVDGVFNWPGLNSLRYQLSGKPMVVKRPAWFFDKTGGALVHCMTLSDGLLWDGCGG